MQKEVDHDWLQSLDIISFFILNQIFLFLFTILVLAFNIKGQKQFSREKSLLFYLETGGLRSFIFFVFRDWSFILERGATEWIR